MKISKYQQEVVKAVLGKQGDKLKMICFEEEYDDKKYVYCSLDSVMLVCIPKSHWVIDIDWLREHNAFEFKSEHIINRNNRVDAVLTVEKRGQEGVHNSKLFTVVKIKSVKDDSCVWIDERFLKYFDNPTFDIADEKPERKGVNVYENGYFVGVIMPVKVAE